MFLCPQGSGDIFTALHDLPALIVDTENTGHTVSAGYVVSKERKGVKKASLSYRVVAEADGLCLVHVRLHTGRTHQIRVQFASRGMPLVGDGKYGSRKNAASPALWSYALTLPMGGAIARIRALPEAAGVWAPFEQALRMLT